MCVPRSVVLESHPGEVGKGSQWDQCQGVQCWDGSSKHLCDFLNLLLCPSLLSRSCSPAHSTSSSTKAASAFLSDLILKKAWSLSLRADPRDDLDPKRFLNSWPQSHLATEKIWEMTQVDTLFSFSLLSSSHLSFPSKVTWKRMNFLHLNDILCDKLCLCAKY